MTMRTNDGFGHRVVDLISTAGTGRLRMPAADMLVAVLTGTAEVSRDGRPPEPLRPGEAHRLSRGCAWSIRPLDGRARLLVVVTPAGPEDFVAALCQDPPLDAQHRLCLALEAGVELLL